MAFNESALDWSNLEDAIRSELLLRNRLMPQRRDYSTLARDPAAITKWLRPQLCKGPSGYAASIVMADKDTRGARPLHIMALADGVLYRIIGNQLRKQLPKPIVNRPPIDDFRRAPLGVDRARYVVQTDVTAYYEYVDHDLLKAELLDQTGEEPVIDALMSLLDSVLSRLVGIPQVHPTSDLLGDVYIDPVRRRMTRHGYTVFTYADDFRLTTRTLGQARAALEACSGEVRRRGLVLNERKTYTWRLENYETSLSSYRDAEARLFQADEPDDPFGLGYLDSNYDQVDSDEPLSLADAPIGGAVDEDDVLVSGADERTRDNEVDPRRADAARRAWDLWDAGADEKAAIRQSLLGRALLSLGAVDDDRPLENLTRLLTTEPGLTPRVISYLRAYAAGGRSARTKIRRGLDLLTGKNVLSPWQKMWVAEVAGDISPAKQEHDYERWLHECVAGDNSAVAATVAAALGRLRRGDPEVIARCVDSCGPEWRTLALFGLAHIDPQAAANIVDSMLERQLVNAVSTG